MKACGALLFVLFCVCVANHTVESSIQFQLHYDNQGTANKNTECENGGRKEVGGGADEHDEINQHDATDQQNIVNIHNQLRRGVQPTASNMLKMMWNEEAAANAQRWANKCILEHSPGVERTINTSGCGENLYMSSAESSWDSAIGAWYDEVKDWKYGEGSVNGGVVGHFTQVVWYRSYQIGCAMAHCPDANYKYFYVCQYCPAGNYGLEHPYKSGPSCGDCPNDCEDKLCTNPCPYIDKWSNCADLGTWGCTTNNCQASCTCTNGQII